MHTCPRCDGEGQIKEYAHIRGGLCFLCSGSGKVARLPRNRGKAPDPEVAAKNMSKIEKAVELYKDDSRARVPYGHQYFYMHAVELAKKDGIWETL
jgi:hypothetical protein